MVRAGGLEWLSLLLGYQFDFGIVAVTLEYQVPSSYP